MKRFYALLIVALFATAPTLMAQSASFYNATRDAEKMIKQMPTTNYHRAYVGYNTAHASWREYGLEGEIMFPINNGVTLGYLESRHVWKGLPLFVEYGANVQYLFGNEKLSGRLLPISRNYKTNIFAVNVPVNLAFRLSFENNTIAVTPFVGLNFRLNLTGKQTETILYGDSEQEESMNLFDPSIEEVGAAGIQVFNRLQLGINFGVAVTYDVYTLSIGRVADVTRLSGDGRGHLGVTSISLGYAF